MVKTLFLWLNCLNRCPFQNCRWCSFGLLFRHLLFRVFLSLSTLSDIPSSLKHKAHFSRQLNCWSLRCSWSIACQRCSNYIFILNLTLGFNGLGKNNYKMTREAYKFWDLVRHILETLRYVWADLALEFNSSMLRVCKIFAAHPPRPRFEPSLVPDPPAVLGM